MTSPLSKRIIENLKTRKEFITPQEFGIFYKIKINKAEEILVKGVELNVLFEALKTTNPKFSKYAPKEIISDENLKLFEDYLSKYGGEIQDSTRILSVDEIELRDSVFQALALRQRDKATELIVKHLERDNFIKTTKDDRASEMWIYREGIYVPQGRSYIKEFCRVILGSFYTVNLANEIISKIEADSFVEQNEFFKNEYPTEQPIQDGILDVLTGELYPFNPKKIFFNKLPLKYNPSAKCPKITEHFKTILRDESDVKVMFELFGYLLLKENRLEKAFMFIGNGRNGKSKTLELMKKFVGIENCSALTLKSMHEESFSLSELFGKMVNLAGDLSSSDLKETGVFKNLVGRDEIQAKRKYLRDLNFVNYAKMVFATNELPKIYDLSDGFWTKWILLEFPYKFVTQAEYDSLKEQDKENKKIIDPDIIQHIASEEELSGLLNEALAGLKRIITQKSFSYSVGTEEVKDLWIRQSDSFTAFCMDFLEENPETKISKKELRRSFHHFCKQFRVKGASDKAIKITLENMFGVLESQGTNYDRVWEGIKFKGSDQQEQQCFSTYRQYLKSAYRVKMGVEPVGCDKNEDLDSYEVVKIGDKPEEQLE